MSEDQLSDGQISTNLKTNSEVNNQSPDQLPKYSRRRFIEWVTKTTAAVAATRALKKSEAVLGSETTASYPPGEKIGNANVETFGANEGLTYVQMQSLFADLNKAYDNGENQKEGTMLYQTIFMRESSYKATANWQEAGYANFEAFAQAHNDEHSRMLQNQGLDGCTLRRIIVVKDDAEIPGTLQTNEQWYQTGIKDSDGTAGDWIYPNSDTYKPSHSAYYNSEKKIDYGWIHEAGHFFLNLPDYYALDVYFQDYEGKPTVALSDTYLELVANRGISFLKSRFPDKSETELFSMISQVTTEFKRRIIETESQLTQASETISLYGTNSSEEEKLQSIGSMDTKTLHYFAQMPDSQIESKFPNVSRDVLKQFKASASSTLIARTTSELQQATATDYDFHTDPFAGMPFYWREFKSLDPNHISPQLFPENMVLPGKSEYSDHFSGLHLKKRKANQQLRDKKHITHEIFALPLDQLPNSVSFKFTDPENKNRWKATSTENIEVTVLQTNGEWLARGIEVNDKFDRVKTTDGTLNVGTMFKETTRTRTLAGDPSATREMVDMSDATYLIRVVKKNKSTGAIIDEGWRWLNWRDAAAGQEPGETAADNLHTEMEFYLHDATKVANWGANDMFRADWTITYNKTKATNFVNIPLVMNN